MYLIEKKIEGVQKNIQVYIENLGIMDVLSRHGVIWIGDTFFLLNQKTKHFFSFLVKLESIEILSNS